MLHDPYMECTCDGDGCYESVMLTMHYYTSGYELRDGDAERQLVDDHDWTVVDGSHYCSPECVPNFVKMKTKDSRNEVGRKYNNTR